MRTNHAARYLAESAYRRADKIERIKDLAFRAFVIAALIAWYWFVG